MKATFNLKRSIGLLKIALSTLYMYYFQGNCDQKNLHIQSSLWLKSEIAMLSDHFTPLFRK